MTNTVRIVEMGARDGLQNEKTPVSPAQRIAFIKKLLARDCTIEERLRRVSGRSHRAALLEDMAAIRRRWSAMQVLDDRPPEEILGYDERGLPR
jgi:hypothetical protein